MRNRTILIVALLCVAFAGHAIGQQQAATSPAKPVTGLSFAFDAQHGQLNASGFAVKATPSSANAVSVTGTIEVTIKIDLVSKFKRDVEFPCAVTVIGGEIDTTNLVVDGGIETASGVAVVSSGTATCTLAIPYTWTLVKDPAAGGGMVIAFAAAGVNRTGATLRSTLQVTGVEPIPASGATSKFTFAASL